MEVTLLGSLHRSGAKGYSVGFQFYNYILQH